jgi:hypothetical protein
MFLFHVCYTPTESGVSRFDSRFGNRTANYLPRYRHSGRRAW